MRALPLLSSNSFFSLKRLPCSRRFLSPGLHICRLPCTKLRLQWSSLAAVSGDTALETNDCNKENRTFLEQSDPTTNHDFSTKNDEDTDNADVEEMDDPNMVRSIDKLIEIFMVDHPTPTAWRKLLIFSKEWSEVRSRFYERCQERADAEEDLDMKHKLLRLGRKLKAVDEDVQRHNEFVAFLRKNPSKIKDIVARRRKDFTNEFFEHLHTVAESYYDDPEEQNAVAKLERTCLVAVQNYDTTTKSIEALNAAELKYKDILNSPSVDVARQKIDNLARGKQIDPALALLATKAWAATNETSVTKGEIKDIMYYMYTKAVISMQEEIPKDIRILKALVPIKDPNELMSMMKDAFTPGEELELEDVSYLYTTPENLYKVIELVVDTYYTNIQAGRETQAGDLMYPNVVDKLIELKKIIRDKFM